jgi:hypothetical protein
MAATASLKSSPSGRLKARAVLKDTGRVLQMSYWPGRSSRQAHPQPPDRAVGPAARAERGKRASRGI